MSPYEIAPLPTIKKKKSNRGRKAIGSCIITGTPYKNALIELLEEADRPTEKSKTMNVKKRLNFEESTNNDSKKSKKFKVEKEIEKKTKKGKGKGKVKEKGWKRTSSDPEDSQGVTSELNIVDDDLSDLDIPAGQSTEDDDAVCMFCEGRFSNDTRGEHWIMCFMCSMWAHNECAGAEKDNYICDFCK